MSIAPNPDVPSTVKTPDTFIYISTAPASIPTDQGKDLFLLAPMLNLGAATTGSPYSLTSGTATLNEIKQYTDIIQVNRAFGRRSAIANRFRSAMQEVPIGINVFLGAIAEPVASGFSGVATKLVAFEGTATGAGEIKLKVCDHLCPVPVSNGDFGSDVALTALAALGGVGGATNSRIPDAPMIPGASINQQAPVVTIAVNATGSNFTITAWGIAKIVAIVAADTPTVAGGKIVAALAADPNFPLTGINDAGVLTLSWRAGFFAGPIAVSNTDATQTYALTFTAGASGTSGVVVPITYVHRGIDGNDSPITVDIPSEITGLRLVAAVLSISTNALGDATNPSLFTIRCGSLTSDTPIAVGTTPVDAATLIATSINNTTFGLQARAAGATVVVIYRSGWIVNRIQLNSTEDAAGQVYTLYDRHDSAGALASIATVPGNANYTALQGVGTPVLTTLLANKAKLPQMIEWMSEWFDSTTVNTEVEHVEQYANGYYQQNQRIIYCDTRDVETVALDVTSPSPALGNYWRYAFITSQDPPTQGGSIAAQFAARLTADSLPYNQDGKVLRTGTLAPLHAPRPDTELGPTTIDVALGNYALTVVKGVNGALTVVRGRTTWGGVGEEFEDLSYGRMFDAIRYGARAFLNQRFAGKVLFVGGGQIRVDNAFTLEDVEAALLDYLYTQDGILIDNAATLGQYIKAEVDLDDSTFIRIAFRIRVPREGHVRSGIVSGV